MYNMSGHLLKKKSQLLELNIFHLFFFSETMTVQSFHFVQTQMEKCYEMMITDKKKIPLWSRRMHLALKAYQVSY